MSILERNQSVEIPRRVAHSNVKTFYLTKLMLVIPMKSAERARGDTYRNAFV